MRGFTVIKPFNNNVILGFDRDKDKECVMVGRGIGFSVVKGQEFYDREKIERIYYIEDDENKAKLNSLYRNVDSSLIGATEEAISYISKVTESDLGKIIHITLLDHLAFTIERIKNGIKIGNPFLYETKVLYEKEFSIAEDVLEIINDRMNLELPKAEVGFIAMHIHAALNNQKSSSVATNAYIIQEMITVIENNLNILIDRESISYMRLLTHLRFAIDRINKKLPIENILLDSIKTQLKDSYMVAIAVADYVKENFNLVMPEEEIGYIAVHIGNIKLRQK
ncbi:PRD domain-containing protein [Clostridium cellulovorans]|uniref:Transcriptional antiterminator, BglG n=1 Tax=Clostridium cellulovorans (strain ATCC 35296 / DSM 3052 / OCM 3 / 743B) TaxID=573061 RepID=D9SKX7_CLOC7|nr:PRD domain-containing protein [Clostridium cellulovorans]ADL53549.1 transcriptional antiterminator, BglG [Clostridium cellulovorans 743B]